MAAVAFAHSGKKHMHPVDDTDQVDRDFPVVLHEPLLGERPHVLDTGVVHQHRGWTLGTGELMESGQTRGVCDIQIC